jgi:rhodanese-related sulfurtransferase
MDRKLKIIGVVLISLFFLSTTGWAVDFLEISTPDLKNKLDGKERFFLVNTMSDIEFKLVNIPGSVNIPVGEIQTTDKLPQDKEALIVFY